MYSYPQKRHSSEFIDLASYGKSRILSIKIFKFLLFLICLSPVTMFLMFKGATPFLNSYVSCNSFFLCNALLSHVLMSWLIVTVVLDDREYDSEQFVGNIDDNHLLRFSS